MCHDHHDALLCTISKDFGALQIKLLNTIPGYRKMITSLTVLESSSEKEVTSYFSFPVEIL
jgi:hypothetical protein